MGISLNPDAGLNHYVVLRPPIIAKTRIKFFIVPIIDRRSLFKYVMTYGPQYRP